MNDITRVLRRVPVFSVAGTIAIVLALVALFYTSNLAEQRENDRERSEQQACIRGNDFRAEVRELALRTAGGFTGLADIIVGDEERTPEQQAEINEARALYDEIVVDPIQALADESGDLGPRNC